jgi:hypothetical protein
VQRNKSASRLRRVSTNLRLAELTRFYRCQSGGEVIDIRHRILETFGADLWAHTPAAVGKIIGLRYELRRTLRIRTIAPVDRSSEEIASLAREQKKLRERQRRARKRPTKPALTFGGDLFDHGCLPERTQAVFDLIPSRNWITAAELGAKLKSIALFGRLEPQALRRAVHRELLQLQLRGLAQRRSTTSRSFQYRRSGRSAAYRGD